jgi:hypothetical protein
MDGREHGGIISAVGRHPPQTRAVYTRVLTAANNASSRAANGVQQLGLALTQQCGKQLPLLD